MCITVLKKYVDFASTKLNDPNAVALLKIALNDKYEGLRNFAISKVDLKKETIKKDLPEGFQRSEFILEHGFLDFIVPRKELKDKLATVLSLFKN